MSRIDCNEIVKRMEERLSADYQIELHEASTVQLHNALAEAVMLPRRTAAKAAARMSACAGHIISARNI